MSHAFIDTKGDYMLELHDEILIEANAVAQLEQERIIRLLGTHLRYVDWEGIFWEPETTGKSHAVDVSDIVALIKGEQK